MGGFPATKEEFEQSVRELMARGALSLVLAVYKVVDELTQRKLQEDGVVLACRKSCSFCCYQMVTCTEVEWREIRSFLKERWREMRKRLVGKALIPWMRYYRENISPDGGEVFQWDPRKLYQDWLGKRPCIFLDQDGSCSIYPVRPIDCRTLTSTKTCISWKQPEAKRFRYKWELWANNLIMEEQERQSRMMATVPLPHWVLLFKKEKERK